VAIDDHHCLDFARTLAAHHSGGGALHDDHERAREIYQTSTLAALLDGVYDGGVSYGELEEHGDFGVGTFNALDGEMIAVDGAFFHLHADGSARQVTPDELTPFAAVTFFRGDATEPIAAMARAEFEAMLDAQLPSKNLFYAIRIDGTFDRVVTRTVGKQVAPYPGLAAATEEQIVRTFEHVTGTIAGFRSPNYAQGMTVAGYHLHFINDERTHGGHVLDFTVIDATLRVDEDPGMHVELPETDEFMNANLDAHDVDREIRAAEGDS
jgi:acetolactate decarboxylase